MSSAFPWWSITIVFRQSLNPSLVTKCEKFLGANSFQTKQLIDPVDGEYNNHFHLYFSTLIDIYPNKKSVNSILLVCHYRNAGKTCQMAYCGIDIH